MSGQQIGAVVGGIIGSYWGQPQLGAAIGGYIGGVIDPTIIQGPSIGDAQQQTSQAGAPIPKCYGHTPPIAVTLIDGDKLARKVIRSEDVGKGATQKTETEHFIATRAFLVCEGEISGFYRITRNGKLVYSTVPGDALDADTGSFASQLTIYTGTETQLPDPSLEAIHGVGNAHAYRGRAYFVVRDDEEIGGAMNRYMVEVAACGEVTTTTGSLLEMGPEFYYPMQGGDYTDHTGNHATLIPGNDYTDGDGIDFNMTPPSSGHTTGTVQAASGGLAESSDDGYTVLVRFRIDDATGVTGDSGAKSLFVHGYDLGHWKILLRSGAGAGDATNMTPQVHIFAESPGSGYGLNGPEPIPVGGTHVMGWRLDGDGNFDLIFDGAVIASATGIVPSSFSGSNTLGGGGNSFDGNIAHAIGFNRALTNAELHRATFLMGRVLPGWYENPDAPGSWTSTKGELVTYGMTKTTISECSAVWKDIVADIWLRAAGFPGV